MITGSKQPGAVIPPPRTVSVVRAAADAFAVLRSVHTLMENPFDEISDRERGLISGVLVTIQDAAPNRPSKTPSAQMEIAEAVLFDCVDAMEEYRECSGCSAETCEVLDQLIEAFGELLVSKMTVGSESLTSLPHGPLSSDMCVDLKKDRS